MRSMTGYGKGVTQTSERTLTIELKAVNNRFLELNSRLPKAFSCYDDIIRKTIAASVSRGSIETLFNYENRMSNCAITVDFPLARSYVNAANSLRDEFLLDSDFNTTALLRLPDVVKVSLVDDDPQIVEQMVRESLAKAVTSLNIMRDEEGKTIKDDISRLVSNITLSLQNVIKCAPRVAIDYKTRLKARMQEILQSIPLDEARLANEVAAYSDKTDINEEISRLSSHINQFLECLESSEPQGRKLDFLSQEMNREINTMGSKSNDLELTNFVIAMKNDLEKIKEQIRNVE